MSLSKIKSDFLDGKISKSEYIERMYELHVLLFEYADFIDNTDIADIEISPNQVLMTSKSTGVKLLCDKFDHRTLSFEILNFGFYEKDELAMIVQLMENGYNVFDIGANVGWYSINLAKIFGNAQIFAFEPIPTTYSYLVRNIENNLLTNIHSYNFGFSDQAGKLSFHFYPEGRGNASLVNVADKEDTQLIACQVEKLDDFVAKNKQSVDFIKCDVEGAELLVFRGGIKAITQYKPIIFTEMLRKWSAKFGYSPNELINLLKDIGYRCFVVQGDQLVEFFYMDESTLQTNFFFMHSVKHASKIEQLIHFPTDGDLR